MFACVGLHARLAVSLDLVPKAVLGLLALLLGNAFIVGINQIYDMEIDKARGRNTER